MGSNNTFSSLQPDLKETYSDKKKDRFKRTKKHLKARKAMAELNASKNPIKYLEENKEPSIKGLKGVAF